MAPEIDAQNILPQPYWLVSTGPTAFPPLKTDLKVDVAIVGGGLVGITAAYLLKQENLTVAVLEADHIGHGTTGHTTAKITSQHNLIYAKLIENFGPEKARQYADANEQAVTFIGDLVQKKQIDCDFSPQEAYVYTCSEAFVQQIADEVKAAVSLGITAHYQEDIPLPLDIKAAIRFDNQGQFHPGKYLLALAGGISGGGSNIFEKTRAVGFQEGVPFTIITEEGHRIIAGSVIIASHFPVYEGGGSYFARAIPDRSYVLAITAEEKFPGGIYITAEPPGRSLRNTPYNGGELILVTGEHHRTGEGPPTEYYFRQVDQFAHQTFTVTGTPFRWSAQDYITVDEVPYAGYLTAKSPNVYVATGFRKWGITNSTAAALLLRDLIVQGKSPWQEVYDPSRFEFDTQFQKYVDIGINLVKKHSADDPENLPARPELLQGESGGVVARKEGNMGIYKDNEGRIHAVNTTCAHMGCQVAWNGVELSWDCPCHGSRYTYKGEIISGPTLRPLEPAMTPESEKP